MFDHRCAIIAEPCFRFLQPQSNVGLATEEYYVRPAQELSPVLVRSRHFTAASSEHPIS